MSSNVRPVAVATLAFAVFSGSQIQAAEPNTGGRAGVPQDWSQRALVYTNPSIPDDAGLVAGAQPWQLRYRDPRYFLSSVNRLQALTPAGTPPVGSTRRAAGDAITLRDSRRGHGSVPAAADASFVRDWSQVLGGGNRARGGRGGHGVYPAKYTFDVFAPPSCSDDFVVYPTFAPGATASGNPEIRVYTMTGGAPAGTITIGARPPRQVVLTAAADDIGFNFDATGGSDDAEAASLAAAVNRWSHQTGIRATSSGADINLEINTSGQGSGSAPVSAALSNLSLPAILSGDGDAGQPTIIAFNQLYQDSTTGCNGPWNQNGATKAPNTMWAYNTGIGYTAETSPVLSFHDDGRQVAFVQRFDSSLQLILLKWQAGSGTPGEPMSPTIASSPSEYRSCSGDCMLRIPFEASLPNNNDATPTVSSPFVDYAADVLWVGDGNGRLHKFTGVFQGNPQEVVGGGFPATVEPGMKLSSPVAFAGDVYVGSQSGGPGIGGKLHRVDAQTGAVTSSAKLAADNTPGLRESPIVAVSGNTANVLAFVFNDGTTRSTLNCRARSSTGNRGCRLIARFVTNFVQGREPNGVAYVGRGNNDASTLYAGAFNEAFYASANGDGALYIVGGARNNAYLPTLWRIPLNGGVLGTPVPGAVVGTDGCAVAANNCEATAWDWSPVTLFQQGGHERLYFSIGRSAANLAGCSTGDCLFMFDLRDLDADGGGADAWGSANRPLSGLATYGGTSGIIVDNAGGAAGTAQVYFAHGGNSDGSGNAVQASQSALD